MLPIARRNLLHDKLRLFIALLGVVFSVVLVACLTGLYVAASRQASGIVDRAGADLWLVAKGTRAFDLGKPVSIRRLYQAKAVPGVLWAEPLLVRYSQWRLADGRCDMAAIIGLAPQTRLNLPWEMAAGSPDAIRYPDGVIIDERDRDRFGCVNRPLAIGDEAEIHDNRATVMGFARDAGSFTTIPYVFTGQRQAEQYTRGNEDETTYVVAKCTPGRSVEATRQRLSIRVPGVDVLTTEEFSELTRHYWLFRTGAGTAMAFAALLGLTVGCVMVSQTIYASTMSRLREYATLKALGMGNLGLTRIVLEQALLLGLKLCRWHGPGLGFGTALGDLDARHRHAALASRGDAARDSRDLRGGQRNECGQGLSLAARNRVSELMP
jgi:putative ABC transport system permease protein